jgi:hypothetical protein
MLPSTGAKVGISVAPASTVIVPIPTASPKAAMPIGRAVATSEPNARNRIAAATRMPTSSPTLPPVPEKLKNSSPPISIRSGELAGCWFPTATSASRSSFDSSDRSGYRTCSTATRPSGETNPLRTAASRLPASVPAGSLVPSTRGSDSTSDCSCASAARAAAESKKVAASSFGVATTCAVTPARSEPACWSRSAACWESSPGTVNESAVFPPMAPAAPRATAATNSHAVITLPGRRAALPPRRERACQNIGSSRTSSAGSPGRCRGRASPPGDAR